MIKILKAAGILTFFMVVAIIIEGCVPVSQSSGGSNNTQGSNFKFQNLTYQDNIKSVRLHPAGSPMAPPVIPLSQNNPLLLTFDELTEDSRNYSVKLIHCNADWTQSRVSNMDYLKEYNYFRINHHDLSFNTKTSFVHYTFEVPRVTMPGNYLLKVFDDSNEDHVILTRRFMVYSEKMGISGDITLSSGISERYTHHQLEFVLNYGNLEISNPRDGIKVVLRKNNKWYNAISNLKPTFIREDVSEVEYQHFNLENNFYAGNEHRFFDLRSVNFLGRNVGEINKENTPIEAYLLQDQSRGEEVYSQYQDFNGKYTVENKDSGDGPLEADYIKTHFYLESPEPVQGNVYIAGEFNGNKLLESNRMHYQPDQNAYTGSLLLKQGYYYYQYYVEGNKNPYILEGNHHETENHYDILVYYRPLSSRGDLLVGYQRLQSGMN